MEKQIIFFSLLFFDILLVVFAVSNTRDKREDLIIDDNVKVMRNAIFGSYGADSNVTIYSSTELLGNVKMKKRVDVDAINFRFKTDYGQVMTLESMFETILNLKRQVADLEELLDEIAPYVVTAHKLYIVSVEQNSNVTILIRFNTWLALDYALSPENYSLRPYLGDVVEVTTPEGNSIKVRFPKALTKGESYVVSVRNVLNFLGQSLPGGAFDFAFNATI